MVLQIRSNNEFELEDPLTVVAEVQSVTEVTCQLPPIRARRSVDDSTAGSVIAFGYQVSVSNDGVTYSDDDVLVIFDSTCVNCSVDGLTTTCVVNVNVFLFYSILSKQNVFAILNDTMCFGNVQPRCQNN